GVHQKQVDTMPRAGGIGEVCWPDAYDAPGAPSAQSEWPEINSAWCNPRMDDDCYINEKKVPVAELGKWLPAVSQSNIDQIGGYCETILCFDKDDQPAGYLLQ
ncbi:hypothetical protein LER23_33705, partial [Pseudomonas aeruginosa]